MEEAFLILSITILISGCIQNITGLCGDCLHPPNIVTKQVVLSSQSTSDSESVLEHGLQEIPIKVDIQVTPLVGDNFTFPGLGSSQIDDDNSYKYGGVIYKYNETHVVIQAPNRNDGYASGSSIFTGKNAWLGPTQQEVATVNVRARAWKDCAFPKPDFDTGWELILSNNLTGSFKEFNHNQGSDPDYVSVQVKLGNTTWVSDAIGGSSMLSAKVNKETQFGGIIYSYDDNVVRLWTPGLDDVGSVYSSADGWGHHSNETYSFGYVRVRLWNHMFGDVLIDLTKPVNTNAHVGIPEINLPKPFSMDHGIIYVGIKGTRDHFTYTGMGAVQNDIPGDRLGGIVYSYSKTGVRIYHPHGRRKYVAYIDPYWGDGSFTHLVHENSGTLIVRAWNSYPDVCPPPTTTTGPSTPSMATSLVVPQSTTSTTTTTTTHSTTSTTIVTTTLSTPTPTPTHSSTELKPTTLVKTTTPTYRPITTTTITTTTTTTTPTPTKKSYLTSTYPLSTLTSTISKTLTTLTTTLKSIPSTTVYVSSPRTTVDPANLTINFGQNTTTQLPMTSSEGGGMSGTAVGLIAAAAVLLGTGCCGGLLYGLFRKFREDKNENNKILPDEESSSESKMEPESDVIEADSIENKNTPPTATEEGPHLTHDINKSTDNDITADRPETALPRSDPVTE